MFGYFKMADLSLIQDEALDDCDEGVFEQGDGPSGEPLDDETLSPLIQFQKYALSKDVFDRQMVPKVLKELFQSAPADSLSRDLPDIMNLFSKLAEEDESIVKNSIFKQLPNLALVALECAEQIPELNNIFSEHLLPIILQKLGNYDNQIRKTAQSTLFYLIKNGLLSKEVAELQVCPIVLDLANSPRVMDSENDSVMLMSKLAPFLGSEITERMFLVRFSELCSHQMFYVRKLCASYFGDFCAVVGRDAYEHTLLPCYMALCNDAVWGVRKACAEVATSVSCQCPSGKRHTILAPVFAKLLLDQSRWVRMSAFQTLGPFISTFAEPSISNLSYNDAGELVVVNNDGTEFSINPTYSDSSLFSSVLYQFQERFNEMEDEILMPEYELHDDFYSKFIGGCDSDKVKIDNVALELIIGDDETRNTTESLSQTEQQHNILDDVGLGECTSETTGEELKNFSDLDNLNIDTSISNSSIGDTSAISDANSCSTYVNGSDTTGDISNGSGDISYISIRNDHCYFKNEYCDKNSTLNNSTELAEKSSEPFNSFNYWYISPELPLDDNILGVTLSPAKPIEPIPEHFIVMEHCTPQNVDTSNEQKESSPSPKDSSPTNLKECDKTSVVNVKPPQDVVPQMLIDHFISMADPNLAENTDKDLAYHCAYSLPAVALTLGRNNWHLLKDTVETLAGNIHYKVRRTVASSLHELAEILGSDMATSNLTPIFDEFIKDLDEVRIGVLKNLAHFLGLISQAKRSLYLPRLAEFLPAKNMSRANWRFRKELADQLLDAVSLFRPFEVTKYISNIAQELLCDKVAAVRESALFLVSALVRYVSNEQKMTSHLLVKLAEKFAHSTNWKRRQTFSLLCANMLMSKAIDLEQFSSDVMPHLLDLSWDPVPNVRLVVGRTISEQMATNRYFYDVDSEHYDSIRTVLRRLQSDKDRDVRHSAVMTPLNAVH